MCGRYTQTKIEAILRKRFRFRPGELELVPRYNIAPTQDAPVVVADGGGRALVLYRWGLVPSWAKDPAVGNRTINARAETLAERPSFRDPLVGRRCLVVADGFYEWRKGPGGRGKTPVLFQVADGEPFAFAGLWDSWRGAAGELRSFTIVTTTPNELVGKVHDRMPAILREEDEEAWLDPGLREPARLLPLLGPYPAARMDARDVSTLVNSPKNDGPECVEPPSPTLF